MQQIILFAILGLSSGAMIAGLAISLVVTYRGSGVINLALGAIAMMAGYSFWGWRTGEFGLVLSTPVACLLTLVFVVFVGLGIDRLVFRPLRSATPVAKVVASLGLLLSFQALATIAFGDQPQQVPSILTSNTVSIAGINVPLAGLIVAGLVTFVAALLAALYRWTGFGLATKAAAENESSAMLVGLQPKTIAMVNTLIGCLVAGGLGVLIGPLTSLDPNTIPLLIIPAMAAALFAGFTSVGVACAVGLAIGSGENLLYYASTQSWFPTDAGVPLPGVEEMLEFILVVIALFIRGARLPGRSAIVDRRLPPVPMPVRIVRPAAATAVVAVVALIALPFGYREALITTEIAAVLMLSMVVVTGFVGQVSVVQLSLAGVAGFTMAHLAQSWHVGFPLAPLLGAGAATLVGLLIGVSALRVRGVQLAVVSLAAAVAIQQFWFANSHWGAGETGDAVSQPTLFGVNLGNAAGFRGIDGKIPSPVLGFLILAIAMAVGLVVANLRRTTLGQRMLAVRSNERAAAAAGISVRNVKLIAFGFGAFVAGISGVMAAYNYGSVSANNYDALTALGIIAFAYIGGITMVAGAVIAAAISTQALVPYFLQSALGVSGNWALLVGGLLLIVNLIFYPDGIAGALRRKGTDASGSPNALLKPGAVGAVFGRSRGARGSPTQAARSSRERQA